MRNTDLREEKDRELYDLYVQCLREHKYASLKEIADWVRVQPASKFYVSAKSLVNYIGAILYGKKSTKMYELNGEKMNLLYEKYLQFMDENPHCALSRERICEILVDEPAPSFFICRTSCINAINREREKHRRALIKRYER